MKKLLFVSLLLATAIITIPTGCKKENTSDLGSNPDSPSPLRGTHANRYNADVAQFWMKVQLRVMASATGIPNVAFARYYGYSAVTLYQSLVPGMPAYQSLASQLTDMPDMPAVTNNLEYSWPASANAAMASILKKLYPATSLANVTSIDSLESALNSQFSQNADAAAITRSVDYGRAVAQLIFDWAQTDGIAHVSDLYTPPGGSGEYWVPTPPASAPASTPYWGNIRKMVATSDDNAQPGPPIPYSTDPASTFYQEAKQVYDVSQVPLTQAQTDMAMYWRDIPGVTSPGHLMNILIQVIDLENPNLEKAAAAYALCGIIANDAAISCWKTKYTYNLVRPITYIRTVLNHGTWSPLLTTPAHPEYSSAHAVISAANASALSSIFGNNYSITDHTYDYMGFPSRSFSSFDALGADAGNSRLYAGIHYQNSINVGLTQGRTVAQNVLQALVLEKNNFPIAAKGIIYFMSDHF